jgi:PP-loop superfamily ATP-utilizing enzyme
MIEAAERLVKEATGAEVIRVRTIGTKAIVEVDERTVSEALSKRALIISELKKLGYLEVEIDPRGYSSGRMFELFTAGNI